MRKGCVGLREFNWFHIMKATTIGNELYIYILPRLGREQASQLYVSC